MNLKKYLIFFVEFWSRPPVSFKCSEHHMTHETAFYFGRNSSNTSQNYLRYKLEITFLEFFESEYPLLFVNRIYNFFALIMLHWPTFMMLQGPYENQSLKTFQKCCKI